MTMYTEPRQKSVHIIYTVTTLCHIWRIVITFYFVCAYLCIGISQIGITAVLLCNFDGSQTIWLIFNTYVYIIGPISFFPTTVVRKESKLSTYSWYTYTYLYYYYYYYNFAHSAGNDDDGVGGRRFLIHHAWCT